MEELSEAGLRLLLDEELYIIDEIINTTEPPNEASNLLKEPDPEAIKLNYKGSNKKGIGIIVQEASHEFLSSSDETLLMNILNAIGLSFDDVAIINHQNTGIAWVDQLQFSKVIVFGVEPTAFSQSIEYYTITPTKNIIWLFSHSLAELAENKTLKGKLWGKLKELFL